jgi:hypothetical protein
MYFYQSGTDRDFAERDMRLGAMNLYHLLRSMPEHGYTEFNFLRGEEEYKLDYHPDRIESERWEIIPGSAATRHKLAQLFRSLKRSKQ